MADFLIRHLEQKGKEHSALTLLANQWEFDAKLIPKALQSVGNLFPHYSRHDESHSKQILVNIERLLGENIAQLTATDTWLLLEAAYWHDIGMVVPQQDIENALALPAFQQYISGIRSNAHHELHQFAEHFDANDMSKCFGGADTPTEAVDKFRQLMAEWFRRQHAERSQRIIQAPWESAGISSPRTELIPARLYKLLGRICCMHGLPFGELLAPTPNGLPFKEVGLGLEDCHPRFVACLLRMGDLLDLDDNRFCPVMQRIAGDRRPKISKAHEDKHASVRHLRIDRERIEITAECETLDGYLETFKWFDWLKQEIQDQMANWQRIVPSRTFGLLPTLGTIAVRMSGELQILNEGQRPQFSIDSASAIALLQGNNLYASRFACVRELLQNAVDATLLRLWLSKSKSFSGDQLDSPFSPAARGILESATVGIELKETEGDSEVPDGKTVWTLTITDEGTGISRKDLGYMLRIGGAQGNFERQERINDMPEWMKPSGAFGIGFQSVFLICEKVTLTTKSIFTNETLQVTMHSPTGCNEGLVLIKPLEDEVSRPCGTIIEVRLLADTFAKTWSISMSDNDSIASQLVHSMDPVLDASFPYEAAKLFDEMRTFAIQSPIPIRARLRTASGTTTTVSEDPPTLCKTVNTWKFVKAKKHELAIRYTPVMADRFPPEVKTLYRGQPFECSSLNFPHVCIEANLMSGKAGSWLTANRDKVASQAIDELRETVLAGLEQQVRNDLLHSEDCGLLSDDNTRRIYSFFLEAMAIRHGSSWAELAKNKLVEGKWLDLPSPDHIHTFRHFFAKKDWMLGEAASSGESSPKGCDLLVGNSWHDYTMSIILNEWLKDTDRTVQVREPELSECSKAAEGNPALNFFQDSEKFRLRYQLMTEPQPQYSEAALSVRLARLTRESLGNARYVLDCDDTWRRLHLKKDIKVRARRIFLTPSSVTTHPVLLPFLYRKSASGRDLRVEATPEQLDALCKWVQPNLVSSCSLTEIRTAYEKLISYIDDQVMRPSLHWQLWKAVREITT